MIYISLTTVPKRLKYWDVIKQNLESLLYQKTNREYYVIFNIPKYYKMGDDEYVVPDELFEYAKDHPRLIINRDVIDYGPIIKTYGALKIATDPNDIIIALDDDYVYHENLLEYHMKKLIEYPEYVVCFASDSAREKIYLTDKGDGLKRFRMHGASVGFPLIEDTYAGSPGHNASASYWRRYFEDDFNEDLFSLADGDDPLMGYYLKKHQRCVIMAKWDMLDFPHAIYNMPIVKSLAYPEYAGGWLIRQKNSQTVHGMMSEELMDLLSDNFYVYIERT
jgi:hypothetical protein